MEPLHHEDDESRESVPSVDTWMAILEEKGLRVVMEDYTPILPELDYRNVRVSRYQLGLPPLPDTEPDTFAIIKLPFGWWGLMNICNGTVVVKAHGPGAYEEIADRWNIKTAAWMAWRARHDGEEGRTEAL